MITVRDCPSPQLFFSKQNLQYLDDIIKLDTFTS